MSLTEMVTISSCESWTTSLLKNNKKKQRFMSDVCECCLLLTQNDFKLRCDAAMSRSKCLLFYFGDNSELQSSNLLMRGVAVTTSLINSGDFTRQAEEQLKKRERRRERVKFSTSSRVKIRNSPIKKRVL